MVPKMAGGELAHSMLPASGVSKPVYRRNVEEFWYFIEGSGQVCHEQDEREVVVDVHQGMSLKIPVGTWFWFKNTEEEPLKFVTVTMPPWPGADEAVKLDEVVWGKIILNEKKKRRKRAKEYSLAGRKTVGRRSEVRPSPITKTTPVCRKVCRK